MYFRRTKDSVPENSNQDIAPRAPELTLAPSGGWWRIFPRWQSLIIYLVGDQPHTGKLASPAGYLPVPVKHLRRVACRIDRDFH
ncbi:hypothetical protein CDAR_205571 [Caerostris darwini]|uniref:Uncharacterized protein n=1 Tax=Caerostris darwini TaxID=1538125 RepID=A0AAV4WSH6_9ARAC|nr:hypothetical protein CDAR_205571 [Caerostris darwini]